MLEGTIVKGYSGFYYVQTKDFLWECSLRGKYRVKDQDFLVGDRVLITPIAEDKAVIEQVLERKNQLTRPAVANVEQVIIVMSFASPKPDLNLLDRLLVLSGHHGLTGIICFNKLDLIAVEVGLKLIKIYQNIGYSVLGVSAKTRQGVGDLEKVFKNKLSVLAGPSGVGKSSLLQAIQPEFVLKTGRVSEKTQRGRHTTRHVELLKLNNGGYVADTPGFSRVDLPQLAREDLAFYFPEIANFGASCRFTNCLHRGEPGCAVEDAFRQGLINEERIKNYQSFLTEVIQNERRY
ncbi:MAG: ribosome small subunit-dependent GTPase A [Bacillota bacterium]